MTSATVLVVEDDADISTVIQAALQRSGHSVVNVPDGRSAIRGLFETRPDLVILDIGLPDLDGFEVLERFRDASDVPILMLTARGRESDKVRALDAGADDYLTKPFGTAEPRPGSRRCCGAHDRATRTPRSSTTGSCRSTSPTAPSRCWVNPCSSLRPSTGCCARSRATPTRCSSAETLLEEAWRDPSATAPTA